MAKFLAIINLLSVIGVIALNYASQAYRWNGTTIGEMSDRYDNLFTPAGYAFSIWGLIFLGLIAYAIFGILRAFSGKKNSDFILQTGLWFTIANVGNAFWVWAFVHDHVTLSLLLMLTILYALGKIVVKTNMERWDAPLPIIFFVWWPICIYFGWIAVATIANFSVFFTKLDWLGDLLDDVTITLIVIGIATLLNLFMIISRNMREFAAVGVWALVAIAYRHWEGYPTIVYVALTGAIVLFVAISIHGYRNRATSPLAKLRNRRG